MSGETEKQKDRQRDAMCCLEGWGGPADTKAGLLKPANPHPLSNSANVLKPTFCTHFKLNVGSLLWLIQRSSNFDYKKKMYFSAYFKTKPVFRGLICSLLIVIAWCLHTKTSSKDEKKTAPKIWTNIRSQK